MKPTNPNDGGKPASGDENALPELAANLTRLERLCMKALWHQHATTVRHVQQALLPSRPLAYTTILTVLDRLHEKGAVRRTKKGKAYLYEPAISFDQSKQTALQDLLEFYFEGSRESLQRHLTSEPAPPSRSLPTWTDISEELL